MSDPHDDRMGRPDGHHYDAPESDEERAGKSWTYLALGHPRRRAAGPDRDRDGADLPDLTTTVRRHAGRRRTPPPPRHLRAPARGDRRGAEGRGGLRVRRPARAGLVLLDTGIGAADEETEAWYRPRRSRSTRRWPTAAGRSTTSTRRQLPPALRPLRRQPAARAAGGSSPSAPSWPRPAPATTPSRRSSTSPASTLRGARRRGRGAARRARHPDARPRRRPPVGRRGLRRRHRSCSPASRTTGVGVERRRAGRAGPRAGPRRAAPDVPALDRPLLAFDPRRVVFAHDAAVWVPEP